MSSKAAPSASTKKTARGKKAAPKKAPLKEIVEIIDDESAPSDDDVKVGVTVGVKVKKEIVEANTFAAPGPPYTQNIFEYGTVVPTTGSQEFLTGNPESTRARFEKSSAKVPSFDLKIQHPNLKATSYQSSTFPTFPYEEVKKLKKKPRQISFKKTQVRKNRLTR